MIKKYISLDDLNKYPIRLDHYDQKNGSVEYVLGVESVLEFASSLPVYVQNKDFYIADKSAQKLIMCKWCKYYKYDNSGYGFCNRISHSFPMKEDDFCSYGKEFLDA